MKNPALPRLLLTASLAITCAPSRTRQSVKGLNAHLLATLILAGGTAFGQPSATAAEAEMHYSVARFGAVGDGKTKNTVAIQKAIDTAAAAGGGTVLFPAGRFLCGTLVL